MSDCFGILCEIVYWVGGGLSKDKTPEMEFTHMQSCMYAIEDIHQIHAVAMKQTKDPSSSMWIVDCGWWVVAQLRRATGASQRKSQGWSYFCSWSYFQSWRYFRSRSRFLGATFRPLFVSELLLKPFVSE